MGCQMSGSILPCFKGLEGFNFSEKDVHAPGNVFFWCSPLQISVTLKWYYELVSSENVFDLLISRSGDGPTVQLPHAPAQMFWQFWCVFISVSEQVKTCSAWLPVVQTGSSGNVWTQRHIYTYCLQLLPLPIYVIFHICYIWIYIVLVTYSKLVITWISRNHLMYQFL